MTLTLGNIKTIALYLSNENIGNLDPYGVVYKMNYIIEGWSYFATTLFTLGKMSLRQLMKKTSKCPSKALLFFAAEQKTGIAPTRWIVEKDLDLVEGKSVTVIWERKKVQGKILAVSGKFQLESINLFESFLTASKCNCSKWCLSHFNSVCCNYIIDDENVLAAKDLEWYAKNFPSAMETGEETENKEEEQEAAETQEKTEPPTKKFRRNKVWSYFVSACVGFLFWKRREVKETVGSLSRDVFEPRTLTGSLCSCF